MRPRYRHPATGVVLLATVGIVWLMAPPSRDPSVALGTLIPDATLASPDGRAGSLHRWLGGEPALLVIASSADSATCADYVREVRVVNQRFPHLRTLVVGSGPLEAGRDIGNAVLADPDRALLRHLGLAAGPVALVVDPAGRIVFIDARRPGNAWRYPLGRLLRDLGAALGGSGRASSG